VVSARTARPLQAFVAAHPGLDPAGCPWAEAVPMDVTEDASVASAAQAVLAAGPVDLVLYCAGHYRAQRATAFDLQDMLRHDQVNYAGALRVLDAVLPHLLMRQSGHISLISSVAGFRGLPQGLAYGPTKAALINLAETLYQDLQASGIGVSLVNPGFVETPLTAQNPFPMPALISPAQAAGEILAGWARGAFEIHFPRRFTCGMKLMRLLPYRLYFAAVRRLTGL
jgi:NAD(P)-dependent dehydrogenase (short-subunit alcohol dehydrogenase family)